VNGSHCGLGDHGIRNATDTCCTQEILASESCRWSDGLHVDVTFTLPITTIPLYGGGGSIDYCEYFKALTIQSVPSGTACHPCVALLISPTGFTPLRLSHLSNPPLCQCCVPDNPNTMRLHEQVRILRKNVLPPPSREKDGGIITIRTTFAPNRRPSYVPYRA
jgi:hypothetical protein